MPLVAAGDITQGSRKSASSHRPSAGFRSASYDGELASAEAKAKAEEEKRLAEEAARPPLRY